MDRQTSRFLTAFEEVSSAAVRRPGGVAREEQVRAVWRAVEDGVLEPGDAETYESLRHLRNSIVHARHDGQLMSRATPSAVHVMEGIRTKLLRKQPTVAAFCGDVATVTPEATVADACRIMREQDFSTLPVVTDAGVHGLLSATDVVWWVGGALDDFELIEDAPVSLVMNAHASVDYELVERGFLQRDVPSLFSGMGRSGCPVGAVLISMTGHPHEGLLGILTPWDLAQINGG